MKILDVKNPRYVSSAGTVIVVDVLFEGNVGYYQYATTSTDTERHGQILYSKAIAGHYGPIAPYSGE